MTPRGKQDKCVSLLISEMKSHGIVPANVFKMADRLGAGLVPSNELTRTFQKLLPQANPILVKTAMKTFGAASDAAVSKQVFLTTFSEQFD